MPKKIKLTPAQSRVIKALLADPELRIETHHYSTCYFVKVLPHPQHGEYVKLKRQQIGDRGSEITDSTVRRLNEMELFNGSREQVSSWQGIRHILNLKPSYRDADLFEFTEPKAKDVIKPDYEYLFCTISNRRVATLKVTKQTKQRIYFKKLLGVRDGEQVWDPVEEYTELDSIDVRCYWSTKQAAAEKLMSNFKSCREQAQSNVVKYTDLIKQLKKEMEQI